MIDPTAAVDQPEERVSWDSHRLWSLWEMLQVYAERYISLGTAIQQATVAFAFADPMPEHGLEAQVMPPQQEHRDKPWHWLTNGDKTLPFYWNKDGQSWEDETSPEKITERGWSWYAVAEPPKKPPTDEDLSRIFDEHDNFYAQARKLLREFGASAEPPRKWSDEEIWAAFQGEFEDGQYTIGKHSALAGRLIHAARRILSGENGS